MIRRFALTALALCLSLALMPAAAANEADRYIVVLKAGSNARSVAAEHAQAHGAQIGHVYEHALDGYSAVIPQSRLETLRSDPRVASITPDSIVQPDAKGGQKGAPTEPSDPPSTEPEALPPGVDRVDGPGTPTLTRGPVDVDVAVIDSGVDGTHPDLNLVGGYWCGNNSATGYDKDENSHGTHVAGTVAAKVNGVGVVGVAPGARIWSYRVPDRKGSWRMSAVICGVDKVTANAATIDVVNMSLGATSTVDDDHNCGLTDNDALHQAICKSVAAGVTYVVSAGNNSGDAMFKRPASYEEVITVSAMADFDGVPGGLAGTQSCENGTTTPTTDQDDTFAYFSNFGADVDITAPGVCVRSTIPGGGYGSKSGTSMSSPTVAGGAALYKATNPAASPAEVRAGLIALGTYDWDPSQDGDAVQEPLLNVSTL